jgi:enoyl-CoA hydratase/carnithine racemase
VEGDVVITGNGPVFCAGLDLKAFAAGADFGGLGAFYSQGFAKPVIAGLNGSALAGRIAANAPIAVAVTKRSRPTLKEQTCALCVASPSSPLSRRSRRRSAPVTWATSGRG